MTVHPTMGNLVRQQLSKIQPRRARPKSEFPKSVKDIMDTRSGGWCEIDHCGPAVAYHHRAPRQSGGSRGGWVNEAANGIAVSDRCHLMIESARLLALDNGWLIKRTGKLTAEDVPVLLHDPILGRRRVLLGNDGSIQPAPEEETA